jgi:MFS family permease
MSLKKRQHHRRCFLGTWICLLATLFFIYEYFLRTFLGAIVYQLSAAFHFNPQDLSLIDVAYFIPYNAMQIPAGLLLDRYGVRFCLTFAIASSVVGAFLFSAADSFYMAFSARILMGFGSAFAFLALLLLLFNWFPEKYAGFLLGIGQFLGVIGPILAGWPFLTLLHHYHDNWRRLLYDVGWLGIVLAILTVLFVRYRKRNNSSVKLLKRFSFKLFITFLKSSSAWVLGLYSGFSYMTITLLGTLWGITYLRTLNLSASSAAFAVSMLWFGLAIGCPLLGLLSDLIKRRKIMLLFCSGLGFVLSLLVLFLPTKNSLVFIFLYFGVGLSGAGQSIAFNVTREVASEAIHAAALAFNNAIIGISNLIFIPLIGFMIHYSFHGTFTGTSIYQHHNFMPAFLCIPALYFIAFFISLFFVQETYCARLKPE